MLQDNPATGYVDEQMGLLKEDSYGPETLPGNGWRFFGWEFWNFGPEFRAWGVFGVEFANFSHNVQVFLCMLWVSFLRDFSSPSTLQQKFGGSSTVHLSQHLFSVDIKFVWYLFLMLMSTYVVPCGLLCLWICFCFILFWHGSNVEAKLTCLNKTEHLPSQLEESRQCTVNPHEKESEHIWSCGFFSQKFFVIWFLLYGCFQK